MRSSNRINFFLFIKINQSIKVQFQVCQHFFFQPKIIFGWFLWTRKAGKKFNSRIQNKMDRSILRLVGLVDLFFGWELAVIMMNSSIVMVTKQTHTHTFLEKILDNSKKKVSQIDQPTRIESKFIKFNHLFLPKKLTKKLTKLSL